MLQGPELRYSKIEKVTLALVIAARRLRQYFQAHTIIIRTDQPIRQILQKSDLAGRMVSWSVELSEFDIQYEPRTIIKAQALTNFLVEMVDSENAPEPIWTLHVDRASSSKGSGAGAILVKEGEIIIELSIKFNFPVSNNQAEYEALIASLKLAKDVGVHRLLICSDSQIMTSQVIEMYQAKDALLQRYLIKVKEPVKEFSDIEFRHVHREENVRADILSKLASTKLGGNNQSLIQETLKLLSIMEPLLIFSVVGAANWTTPII